MATLNVYLPEALKERMKDLNLNWSQIATSAIGAAIELEERKAVSMEEASLQRLRESKRAAAAARGADAEGAGKQWALNVAEFDELERVAALRDHATTTKGELSYALAAAILDDDRPSGRDVSELFEQILGRAEPSDEEARGFIDGAIEVFDQV